MRASRIQAVDNVRLEAPVGLEDELRWFYGQVAQLSEEVLDTPDDGQICFSSEGIRLLILLVEAPEVEPIAARITIAVPSLDEILELFEERKITYERVSGLTWTDQRVYTHDPAGHRIGFKKAWPRRVF